jgi:hypothetical protein
MFSRRKSRLFVYMVLALIMAIGIVRGGKTAASIMFNRSVVISTGTPSAVATHSFRFDIPTNTTIGSMVFEYCSNTPDFFEACTAPAGLDLSAANLVSQTGNSGFSIDNSSSTPNKIVLTRPPSAGNAVPSSYIFDNITNPSAAGTATYVKISTHNTIDGSGPWQDNGAVAFATQNIFNVGAYVPPFLKLCVGISVAPDCSTMSGDSVDFGDLSKTQARFGQSQFATATNDPSGYIIFADGTTMTSGNNTIPALANPTASFPGSGQFGFNLRANLVPAVGQDPVGLGTAAPTANYNTPNRFTFIPGDSITTANLPSNYNRMTVSYIVNIPASQTAGIYVTTINYIATVQF